MVRPRRVHKVFPWLAPAIVLWLAGTITPASGQLETRGTTSFAFGYGSGSIAVGDFNRDGNLDIAISQGELQIFLGNGDGTFQPPISYAAGTEPSSVTAADFNGDGMLDLAVADHGSASTSVYVFFGNGDGTFKGPTILNTTASDVGFVAVGDFNGDHKPDLIVTDGAYLSVFLNNGDGTFAAPIDTSGGASALAVGDFDHDGTLDVAAAQSNQFGASVMILLGNGDGTFRQGASYALVYPASSIAVGDFRSNGKLDLAIATSIGGAVSVFLGNGDGTFEQSVNYTYFVAYWIAVADMNGDNKPDLVISNFSGNGFSTGSVQILLGNGDGAFQPQEGFAAATTSEFLAVGDFNGDHKIDVIDMDGLDMYVMTLLNTGTVTFSPTSPLTFPTQLVGATSPPLTATLKNSGTGNLSISSVTFSGPPFKMRTTCHGSIVPGGQCAITATFTAAVEGVTSGLVTIKDSVSSKPQFVELIGTGTVVKFTPAKLTFSLQKVGTKSAPQTIQLTNTGDQNLIFTRTMYVGGKDYNDFSETNNCSAQIGPGASCNINVTFAPRKTGARNANVTVSDDGGGSPQTPQLSGTGD